MTIVVLGAFVAHAARAGNEIASAQGDADGTLPAYGEPVVFNAPATVARVFAADFNRDDTVDIAVVSGPPLARITVYLGLGNGAFDPGLATARGGQNGYPLLGDFNGDGTPDFAFQEGADVSGGTSAVGVQFGNGDGTFQPYQVAGALPYPSRVVVGDLDGDGKSDLAAAGTWSGLLGELCGGIRFLWGRADGSFDSSTLEQEPGVTGVIHILSAGDFNSDGVPDLVWKQANDGKFVVLLGQGNRTFGSTIEQSLPGEPGGFGSADFDGDGTLDLAVRYRGPRGTPSTLLGVLLGNGDGTFQPVTPSAAFDDWEVSGGGDLVVCDVDGDGKPDLVVHTNRSVVLEVNSGDGRFRSYAVTAGTTKPHPDNRLLDVSIADLDSDGRVDFVTAWTDNKVGSYLGIPAPSTALTQSSSTSLLGQAVTLTATVTPTDLTGPVTFYDGASVIGSGALGGGQAVFTTTALGPGTHALRAGYGGTLVGAPASFSVPVSHTVDPLPASVLLAAAEAETGFPLAGLAAGDFDNDGFPDLAVSARDSSEFEVWVGNGDGTFRQGGEFWGGVAGARPVSLGDVNQDGNLDVVLGEASAGNGDGTFNWLASWRPPILLGDLNRDGKLDQVQLGAGEFTVWAGLGDGHPSSSPTFTVTLATHPSEAALADFNGDGNLDAAVSTELENRLSILLGNGDGTFQAPLVSATAARPISPAVADFNGDGTVDLALLHTDSGIVSVLLGRGDGGFTPAVDVVIGGTLTRMAAADLDGDSKPDLAVLSATEHRVLVLTGAGDGTFGAPRKYYAGADPVDLVAADFNGDARTDLAIASSAGYSAGRIVVLLGADAIPTSVVLDVVPPSSMLSQPVTMTATVSPSAASGWVAFYDGANQLGSAPVSGGRAVFQTVLLDSGTHLLRAVFSRGGTAYGASTSPQKIQKVAASSVFAFGPPVTLSPGDADLAARADFDADGKVDLAVCSRARDDVTVMLGAGDGQFSTVASYHVSGASSLLAADFNLDGHADLLTDADHLLRGNGDGTMVPPADVSWNSVWRSLAADFNADGAPDFVDADARALLLNRRDGTFEFPNVIDLGSCQPARFNPAIGDFNGDGYADLAFPDEAHAYACVLLGNGDGTFGEAVRYPTVGNPTAIATGDFNGDGVLDLAAGAGGRIGIMLGLGDGTFENNGDALNGLPRSQYSDHYLGTCDCDGDGNVDLLAWTAETQQVKILRGLGNGTFQAGVPYAAIGGRLAFLADLNQDGRPDIVSYESAGGTPAVVARMGVLASAVGLAVTPGAATLSDEVTLTAVITPADASGTVTFTDGATVLGTAAVVAGHAVLKTKWLGAGPHVLRASYSGDPMRYAGSMSVGVTLTVTAASSAGFGAGTTFRTGRGPAGLATGDLDGDEKLDLVIANATSNTISVLKGDGAGGFAPRVNYNTSSTPAALAVGHLDGGGTLDVVVANSNSNNVSLLLGNGDGSLQPASNYGVGDSPRALVVADVNADLAADVVVGMSRDGGSGGSLKALLATGGTWSERSLSWWAAAAGVAAADLNGDGRVDVAVAGGEGQVGVLLQRPDSAFDAVWPQATVGVAPSGLAMGDFNGDGKLDLATANQGSSDVSVLLGKGDGTFQTAVSYAAGTGPTAIVAADCDGDGNLDLAIANGGANSLTVLAGVGDGTFVAGAPLVTGGSPAGVVAADFDGNGVTDLAVTNAADDTVTVFLGVAPSVPTPAVASIAPARGPMAAGTALTITGTGFVAGHTQVTVGGVAATNVTVVSPTQVTAVAPAHAPGAVDVVVTTPGGAVTAAQAFAYVNVATGRGLEFDGDLVTDISVYRPSSGEWFVLGSASGFTSGHALKFGSPGDEPVAGDFDGDGKRDAAVYRPATGTWFWLDSSSNGTTYGYVGWGLQGQGDVPVPGDYDGDGKTDPTVFRPKHGTWFVLKSSSGYTRYAAYGWGGVGDTLVPGDYDGDGTSDAAVYRAETGEWFVLPSSTGFDPSSAVRRVFGQPGDVPVAGDFDGDGKRDFAVYRPATGTWFWLKSSTGDTEYEFRGWGIQAQGDEPVPGEYDGDGKTDLCVYRPQYGTWFVLHSATGNGTYSMHGWGNATDVPLATRTLVAPALVVTGPTVVRSHDLVSFTAITWLPDPVRYRFNTGDGLSYYFATSASAVSFQHSYSQVGTFSVTVEVETSGAEAYTAKTIVTVLP